MCVPHSSVLPEEIADGLEAAEFLMSSGFSIDAVCQQGVRYLSRDEEIKVREILNQRFQNDLKRREDDIQITGEDVLGFVNAVRSAIDEWLSQGEVSPLLS